MITQVLWKEFSFINFWNYAGSYFFPTEYSDSDCPYLRQNDNENYALFFNVSLAVQHMVRSICLNSTVLIFHLDGMSFTWKELQYCLLCRRQQKVWFHLAGKAEPNPVNKTTKLYSLCPSVNYTLKVKTWITESPKVYIICFKNEGQPGFLWLYTH